jgi:hypothetical protein
MSQVKKTGPQFDQGEGGAGSTKSNGSHLSPASDVVRQGPTGDHMTPLKPATRPTGNAQDGKSWNIPSSDKTAVRGGGGIGGHSRDPVAKRSGSKNAQNPNVNTKNRGPSGTYLGK